MHKIFISHSSQDKKQANLICKTMDDNHIPCWIAPRNISAGENFAEVIPTAIEQSTYFVVLISKNALDSVQVIKEVTLATRYRKKLIAIFLEDIPLTNAFDYHLSTSQWIPLYQNPERELQKLMKAVASENETETEQTIITREFDFISPLATITGVFITIALVGFLLKQTLNEKLEPYISWIPFEWALILAVVMLFIGSAFLLYSYFTRGDFTSVWNDLQKFFSDEE
jgi:hypothetical protein